MTTSGPATWMKVQKRHDMCTLLEENIVANFDKLTTTTSYSETLVVTEDKQYRNRGLLHIEDLAYEFFLELEVLHVSNVNDQKLAQHKKAMIDKAVKAMKENPNLRAKWHACFLPTTLQCKQENVLLYHVNVCQIFVIIHPFPAQ